MPVVKKMAKLKDARKEGRELLRHKTYAYICYRKDVEFYVSDCNDGYAVFFLYKNGDLEKILNTNHARCFHAELKRRKKLRR